MADTIDSNFVIGRNFRFLPRPKFIFETDPESIETAVGISPFEIVVRQRVVKSYPATTHTHTIEYRVASEEQLKQILGSAREAFESGRSATFQLPNQ